MAIGMLLVVPGGTQDMYDKAMHHLGFTSNGGKWPEDVLSHTAGPSGKDWVVVDIWKSRESFDSFFAEKLQHALKAAQIPPSEPKFFDVYLSHTS
jgi:hypothetical protein